MGIATELSRGKLSHGIVLELLKRKLSSGNCPRVVQGEILHRERCTDGEVCSHVIIKYLMLISFSLHLSFVITQELVNYIHDLVKLLYSVQI